MNYIEIQPHILTIENGSILNSGVTFGCTITKKSGDTSSTQSVSLSVGSYVAASFEEVEASIEFTGVLTSAISSSYKLKMIACEASEYYSDSYVLCLGKRSDASPLSGIVLTNYLSEATDSTHPIRIDVYYYVEKIAKTIRFNTNGGTSATPEDITYNLGSTSSITLPARPTKTNGSTTTTAVGWCIPGIQTTYTSSISNPQKVIFGNITMFAMWSSSDYTSDTFIDSMVYKPI